MDASPNPSEQIYDQIADCCVGVLGGCEARNEDLPLVPSGGFRRHRGVLSLFLCRPIRDQTTDNGEALGLLWDLGI